MPAAFVVRALPSRSSKYHRPACPRRSPTRCGLDNDTVTAIAAVVGTGVGVVGTGISVANFLRQGRKELKEKIDSLSSETKDEFKSMGNKMEKKIDSAVTDISKLGEKTAVISVKLENVESATEKLEKTMMLLAQDFAKRDKAWEARFAKQDKAWEAFEARIVGVVEASKPPFRNGIDGVQLTFAGSPEHHVVAPVFVGSPTTAAFQCARDLAPTRLRKVRLMSLATGHFLDEEESGGKTLGMDELSQGLRVFSGAGANSS
mmetsp:Transcript_28514/g.69411  ORF Transcript_28514/g.69411 Transcript_28514/m.69411 type:complete len:261 (+) Transcript_28514:298-1080(+)